MGCMFLSKDTMRATIHTIALSVMFFCWTVSSQGQFEKVITRGGLHNIFAKLNRGEHATIVYLGGSITEAEGWRVNIGNWFNAQYPGLVTNLGAGWGGTGSSVAACRFQRMVIDPEADLVFIEFAVNDVWVTNMNIVRRNYEGMFRQAWMNRPDMDICLIETVCTSSNCSNRGADPYIPASGEMPCVIRDAHYPLADVYSVPSVNVGWALWEQVLAGTPRETLLPDGVHPSTAGHLVYSNTILSLLENQRSQTGANLAHSLPHRVTDYPIEGSVVVWLGNGSYTGWTTGTDYPGAPTYIKSNNPGAEITLGFTGPIAVWRYINNTDGGILAYSVDGGSRQTQNTHDSNMWAYSSPLAQELDINQSHSVTLRNDSWTGQDTVRILTFESAAPLGPEPSPGPQPTPVPCLLTECFDTLPNWSSTHDDSGAAGWTVINSQAGKCLQVSRNSPGSSARVLNFPVPPNTPCDLSIYMKTGGTYTACFWAETAYREGTHTAQDFNQNSTAWTMIQKFDGDCGAFPNGQTTWTQYQANNVTFTGTTISVGLKLGCGDTTSVTANWDSLNVAARNVSPTVTRTATLGPTATATVTPTAGTSCMGDANGDRFVNGDDFRSVRDHFGQSTCTLGDANHDCFVNGDDFRSVRDNFGRGCTR